MRVTDHGLAKALVVRLHSPAILPAGQQWFRWYLTYAGAVGPRISSRPISLRTLIDTGSSENCVRTVEEGVVGHADVPGEFPLDFSGDFQPVDNHG